MVNVLEGKIELKVLLDWQQVISWCGELIFDGINIVKEVLDWLLKFNGWIKIQGSLYGGSWQMLVLELKIIGNVKQNKVDVVGLLQGNSYLQWKILGLYLVLGLNSVDIKGELGVKDFNFDVIIDVLYLDNVLLGFGGMVKGLVKVCGIVDVLQLLVDIIVWVLCWQELIIVQVNVKGDVKFIDQIGGNLDVWVDCISQLGVNISLVQFNVKGIEKQYELWLCVQGELVFGQLVLVGSFDCQVECWKGLLSDICFQMLVGLVVLMCSIVLDYCNLEQKISIGLYCWINLNVEFCVFEIIDVGVSGWVWVNFNCFDLVMFKLFMLEVIQVSGVFIGNVDVSWDIIKEGLLQGKVIFSGCNVKVIQVVNDVLLLVVFDMLNFSVDLYNNCVELGWFICLINNG